LIKLFEIKTNQARLNWFFILKDLNVPMVQLQFYLQDVVKGINVVNPAWINTKLIYYNPNFLDNLFGV